MIMSSRNFYFRLILSDALYACCQRSEDCRKYGTLKICRLALFRCWLKIYCSWLFQNSILLKADPMFAAVFFRLTLHTSTICNSSKLHIHNDVRLLNQIFFLQLLYFNLTSVVSCRKASTAHSAMLSRKAVHCCLTNPNQGNRIRPPDFAHWLISSPFPSDTSLEDNTHRPSPT